MHRLALTLLLALTLTAAAQIPTPAAQTPTPVAIHVDLAHSLGPYRPIGTFFGYDESDYSFAPHGRQLLREMHDLAPTPIYVRAHHLFTSGDGVPALKWSSSNVFTLDAAGKPVYDFTILDQIFDAYRDAGVRPMVELGFMPKDLATGTMPYYQPYPNTVRGSVQSPPKDYAMWGDLCYRFTQHLVERYGRAAVATWYFEVWNEPDGGYWQGTPADYFKLYDYSVAGVRKALPTAKVGGPAITGPGSSRATTFLQGFFKHCAQDKSAANGQPIPLDFVSFHPKGSPHVVDRSGQPIPVNPLSSVPWASLPRDGHVRMGISNELNVAANGFRLVAANAKYRNLPIILSEADPEGCAACSAKQNPANAYRNGPIYPTYTAVAMKALLDLAAASHVNLVGMVTWAFEFEDKQYFEGFRDLATNGIDKPVLNVFRMAGLLSGDRVAATSTASIPAEDIVKHGVHPAPDATTPPANRAASSPTTGPTPAFDIDAIATKSTHEAAVMLWNYSDDDLPAPSAPVTVTIDGIPATVHRVRLEHFRIDDTHSNAYTAWLALGSPQSPTPEQYAQLRAAGQLQSLTSPQWLDVTAGSVTLPIDLPRQATSLFHLEW
jgi:xylan 1,4-beta-xylosidase